MDLWLSLFLGLPVLGAIVLCLRICWLDRDDSFAHTAYAALYSPSVRTARNAFDRRVALAVREAKRGAKECTACGFANAMHTVTCVRCSAALQSVKTKSTPRAGWFGGAAASPPPQHLSDRQRRIRRRREWMRSLNDQGRLEWRRDAQFADPAQPGPFPVYVLQTEPGLGPATPLLPPSPSPSASRPLPPSEETPIAIVIATEESTDKLQTIATITTELQTEFNNLVSSIVQACEADASRIAYAKRKTLLTVDSASNAELVFPAKLAQFITSMAGIVGAANDEAGGDGAGYASCRLRLARQRLLTDSMVELAILTPAQVRAPIRVSFEDEQGIDAGGVYREWFLLLNEAIVTPEAGVFVCVDQQDQTFYLNPHSRELLGENHLAHFLAAGRLLGRALLDGNVTGFHLSLPLLKIILGLPVGFDDLQYFDPEIYKSLKWLLEYDGVDALCLDFTVVEKLPSGNIRTEELLAGGSDIDVTDENKMEFVDRKLKYLLFESVASQLFAFLKGVYEVVPAELLAMFDAEELDYVLSGSDVIDVDDWEANTLTSENLESLPCTKNFWKVVRELSTEERRHLLQFATGSTRVPPGGFCALTSNDGKLALFNLRGVRAKTTRGYLHSHACFNRLDLPMHGSLKPMRHAVRAAISSDNIGFTTD